MTDDATLSDFGSTGATDDDDERRSDSSDDERRNSSVVDEPERTPGDDETDTVEPDGSETVDVESNGDEAARSTYAWGSYTCSRCDTETERVWREEKTFVCPGCKSW